MSIFSKDVDYLEMLMIPKGSGSENMSTMKMFVPADGINGPEKVRPRQRHRRGGQSLSAGHHRRGHGRYRGSRHASGQGAIARPVGQRNPDPEVAQMEQDWRMQSTPPAAAPWGWAAMFPPWRSTLKRPIPTFTLESGSRQYAMLAGHAGARAKIYPDGRVEYGY